MWSTDTLGKSVPGGEMNRSIADPDQPNTARPVAAVATVGSALRLIVLGLLAKLN